jgi:hypothetical protein
LLGVTSLLFAQTDFQQEGYVDYRGFAFPETTSNDRANFIGEALVRYDVIYGLAPGLKLQGGTETRIDTHRQTERAFKLNWNDRGTKRPNFSIRRFSILYGRGRLKFEAGKQLIHWGKADILNPTDRFAPRDYLSVVVDNGPLAVFAARVIYESRTDTLEFVAQPFFTPSRIPLLNQRWTMLPEDVRAIPLNDQGSRYPAGPQWGTRWNHAADGYEMSLSLFDGYNHLPLLQSAIKPNEMDFQRYFPQMRMYGSDLAIPLKVFRLKAEAAYFTSTAKEADEYLLYVLQLECKTPNWSLMGGYAGEAITRKGEGVPFAPDRGLARAFLGRAAYTIDATRAVSLETAVRQNGDGLWLRSEYAQAWGQHWKATAGMTILRGEPKDFLGQYRKNSFFNLSFRYIF